MNDNIIVSSLHAEEINKKVKGKVAPHLFVFCNYNPKSLIAYSIDAKFFYAVMNLYKLLIDAGLCNRIGNLKKAYKLSCDAEELVKIIDVVNALRTFAGHNLDEKSGNANDIKAVEKWFNSQIRKKTPNSIDEYAKPLETLYQYGDDIVKVIDAFIDDVSAHPLKNDIVSEWEQYVIEYYRRPNSKNIYKGYLELTYRGRKGSAMEVNKADIAMWTQKMLTKELEINNNLRSLVKGRNLPTKALQAIDEKIKENEQILSARVAEIAKTVDKTEAELIMYDYYDYYVSIFPLKIKKMLENGKVTSLLPQDIVQQIIDDDFDGVTID